jgi:hypothetical protein
MDYGRINERFAARFILARKQSSQTMRSSPQLSRKYALILTGMVLCSTALSTGCNSYSRKQDDRSNAAEGTQAGEKKHHDHPNTTKGTEAAVKEIVAVLEKSLADLPPPPSVPAVCEAEMRKLREVLKTTQGTGDAEANSALLRCMSKATNETTCKGKPQPCGVAYYNPPLKPPAAGQPVSEPSGLKTVDVSAPDQIAAACREIAEAGEAGLSASGDADPATGSKLGSMVGEYSCGAWFKAAATNDPALLIIPTFVPTIRLVRDLRSYTNGVIDVTPEAVLENQIKRVDRAVVVSRIGGTFIPAGVLPIVPVGGTRGEVLDGAHETVQQRVNQLGKAVGDGCKAAGICQ